MISNIFENLSFSQSHSILLSDIFLTTVISELNTSQRRYWTWEDRVVGRKGNLINLPLKIVKMRSPSSK